jgi:hypothetical protein
MSDCRAAKKWTEESILGWSARPSWLAGVALSTTSVAVVYAVTLELGFNTTEFGKAILAAYFINDLGTVIALGLIFSPFYRYFGDGVFGPCQQTQGVSEFLIPAGSHRPVMTTIVDQWQPAVHLCKKYSPKYIPALDKGAVCRLPA